MSNKDWQVGPVLKDKLGSQGTLFRGGTKYSSPQRFPRGYTPERLAEVRDAVQPTSTRRYDDEVLPAHLQRTRIIDTVARSTVPVKHLQGLQWAPVMEGQEVTSSGNAAGAYFAGRDVKEGSVAAERAGGVYRAPAMIAVKPKYDRSKTVIHEIGHHVSHEIEETEHSKNYSYTTEHGGAEEAKADNYAEEHFRNRQGKQEEVPTYGGGQYAGRIERSDEFWRGYHKNRENIMYRQWAAKQDERFYQQYPEEVVHARDTSRQHDYPPLINKPYLSEEALARGERHEIEINPDAEPEPEWHSKYKWSM